MSTASQDPQPAFRIGVGDVSLSALEKQYVNAVLDSNRLSYGAFSRRFEAQFAEEHSVRHAVLSNSGTSALHVAVLALKEKYGWLDGDEIIVPATTFVATANVVLMAGLRPVFADVDPRTYNISPLCIETAVTQRTKAVIPVHLCGLPADMPSIMEICRHRGLRVIEDSCEAMFTGVDGKPIGSFGDIGCFSMYAAHIITAGVGGIAVTDNDDLAVTMRSLCNHGRDPAYLAMGDGLDAPEPGWRSVMERRFRFVRLGASYRITELEAALALAQFERRMDLLDARARNAAAIAEGLRDLELAGIIQLPFVPPGAQHVFMFFPIVLTAPVVSREAVTFFLEQKGIETRPLMPLINQPVYSDLLAGHTADFPVARWLNERAFYVGCHPGLQQEDLEYMIDSLQAAIRR